MLAMLRPLFLLRSEARDCSLTVGPDPKHTTKKDLLDRAAANDEKIYVRGVPPGLGIVPQEVPRARRHQPA